jgi:hypothetical protein
VPITIGIRLEEDCSGGVARGISGYGEWGREVRKTEDWFGKEGLLKAVKR